MKVKELIELLNKADPEEPIFVWSADKQYLGFVMLDRLRQLRYDKDKVVIFGDHLVISGLFANDTRGSAA